MKQTFTREEVITVVKKILDCSDDTYKDEWYATDYTFTRHGIDQLMNALDIQQEEIDEHSVNWSN